MSKWNMKFCSLKVFLKIPKLTTKLSKVNVIEPSAKRIKHFVELPSTKLEAIIFVTYESIVEVDKDL